MPTLQGTISIQALPPHRGLMVHLGIIAVTGPDVPLPYGGHPPAKAFTDAIKVFDKVNLNSEWLETAIDVPFRVELPRGHYYVQVRAILLRAKAGEIFAQAEGFFVGPQPIYVGADRNGDVSYPVAWPTTRLEDMQHYGTVTPGRKRPWWKFW
jgi:hypothetical protein